ncbi:MAG TPA: helix-turn-helix transcriptional regulator [Solirubrobacteraceae bacterium]|jgi:AraC family transcriptional regulator of adaptative response / methylphosphotriester-DNA alkyltransferase methyltransferase|nr:helix-turn-helix transcriptional regulator [Solirubrobacteraceae bacterium]
MRPSTIEQRRRLYLLARVVIARHYRQPLTLEGVARALSSSPRQLTRVYAQFGETTFREDLLTRRLRVAAQLLVEQPAIPVRDVARLVGFRQAPHFAKAFRRRYGLTPAGFRAEGRAYARGEASRRRAAPRPGAGVAPQARRPAGAGASEFPRREPAGR